MVPKEHKGTALTREAHQLLTRAGTLGRSAGFDYLGYVEGRDIFRGHADVVVTDGFTGISRCKSCEGLVEWLTQAIREEVTRESVLEKLGALLMRPASPVPPAQRLCGNRRRTSGWGGWGRADLPRILRRTVHQERRAGGLRSGSRASATRDGAGGGRARLSVARGGAYGRRKRNRVRAEFYDKGHDLLRLAQVRKNRCYGSTADF